ncbi:IS1 family transposase [Candidatus Lariskella endosymbiont of Hedychridium roseum]|uniref:IS1 family transposase n=1 Tax=Candidatus Lariskella endosymbiont of Hedychridium roseum TaxID=3077949 RepID=UPI0030CC435E
MVQKNKLWIIKAVDRSTRRTVAWVTGNRDTATFQKLYNKVSHLKECHFYTDDWDAFSKILPKERHTIGKSGTVCIERDNSNTRHHLCRMTRRTKIVSKKRVNGIRIHQALVRSYYYTNIQTISRTALIYLYVKTLNIYTCYTFQNWRLKDRLLCIDYTHASLLLPSSFEV